jgi:lysozyme
MATYRLVGLGLTAAFAAVLSACSSGSSAPERVGCRESAPLKVCEDAGTLLHGVDVSTYQSTVDWAKVKAAGITFAFARISDGTANPDAQFAANWQAMKQNGVVRGAYQYFRASVDPTAQAHLVATSLQKAGGLQSGDLPVVMDIETADGQPESIIEANMRTWLAAVEASTARTPILYTSAGTYPVTTAAFASYVLWVANYGAMCPSMPTGWSQWKLWQTSSTGMVNGIAGSVDLDEYAGTLASLMGLGGGAARDSGAPSSPGDGGHPADAGVIPDAGDVVDGEGVNGSTPGSDASDGGGAAMGLAGRAQTQPDDASLPPCGP